jgi:DNA modification methylase
MTHTLHLGDCRTALATLDDASIDAIVCDPPYELGFMGKAWDNSGIAYDVTVWQQCLRVLKPGGHLVAFGGSRTYHRLAVAIEDAGFEIRDQIQWIYAQGFPKGLDVAWQLHKKASTICGIMVVNENMEERNASEISEQKTEYQMRFVRASYLSAPVYACTKCGQVLQPFMQEQNTQELRQAWQKSEISWSKQSCMERWGNTQAPKGQLQRCEVCTLSHGVFADGSQGWVHHGAQDSDGSIPWQVTNEDGSRPSYRPQSIEQLHNQFDAFFIECRAQEIRGYNVALKPAHEPAVLARKPLCGTVADNVKAWGVGALNIDGTRVGTDEVVEKNAIHSEHGYWHNANGGTPRHNGNGTAHTAGRWPANVIFDEEAAQILDEQSGERKSPKPNAAIPYGQGDHYETNYIYRKGLQRNIQGVAPYGDSGGASRFFYTAKASKAEREAGLYYEDWQSAGVAGWNSESMEYRIVNGVPTNPKAPPSQRANHHPTVKPLALMRYLVRLVTPPGGTVLDPFMGSGSTGCAAVLEGCDFVGIDITPEYVAIAQKRIAHYAVETPLEGI